MSASTAKILKILFDTNVVLDVLLDRQPFSRPATLLMRYVERGAIEGLLAATTVTTIYYVASNAAGRKRADEHVETLLALYQVASVNKEILSDALSLGFNDYEDAVLHETARRAGVTGIVTRDQKGFAKATLSVHSPEGLLKMLRAATSPR